MAASKKHKGIRQNEYPAGKLVKREVNLQYYSENPTWRFKDLDTEMWALDRENINEYFCDEILPRLKNLESQTWNEILVKASKENHFIDISTLNKSAQQRLTELHIEAESLLSLRVTATHRIYGYMEGRIFHILWFDTGHGDNDTCVCRSHKKHT